MIVFLLVILVLAAALFFHFKSIAYTFNDDGIEIASGIIIKTGKFIDKKNILWKTAVKIGKFVPITVLHTAGGRVILFTDAKELWL